MSLVRITERDGQRRGFSTLELVLALALLALALVILVPRLSPRPLYLTADAQELAANLKVARSFAQSRSTHYQVRVASSTQYVVERGELVGSVWTFPVTERTVTLRPGIAFSAADVGKAVSFDSRGRVVGSEVTFTLVDGARGWTRPVVVRVTGLVEMP